jgi:hypothetical protein
MRPGQDGEGLPVTALGLLDEVAIQPIALRLESGCLRSIGMPSDSTEWSGAVRVQSRIRGPVRMRSSTREGAREPVHDRGVLWSIGAEELRGDGGPSRPVAEASTAGQTSGASSVPDGCRSAHSPW